MVKQGIKMPNKREYVRLKNYEMKPKSPYLFYADFGSILVPEDSKKQKHEESYASKYQKDVYCNYGYKIICADDKLPSHI